MNTVPFLITNFLQRKKKIIISKESLKPAQAVNFESAKKVNKKSNAEKHMQKNKAGKIIPEDFKRLPFNATQLYQRRCAFLKLLNQLFPAAFNETLTPLKIGIDRDLTEFVKSNPHSNYSAVSQRLLKKTLSFYVRQKQYRKNVEEGKARIDLQGKLV